ncbi:hypothetical protein [uncultured Bacteroides sp.]|uniref:hypothetical protein n=1 Tax=uncultured Bacteroides sp. TaxID=162156 RepID=UPI0025D380D1|nr:hypothetical protein [uncultured Bacteroides sp.]
MIRSYWVYIFISILVFSSGANCSCSHRKIYGEYYDRLAYSYNVPHFTSKPVQLERWKVERRIVSKKRVPVEFR